MTEWWQNDRHLRIHFFSPSPKTPSFHLIPSFHIIFEWQRMKITMGRYHSLVILDIYTSFQAAASFKNDDEMTEWGEMKGDFWSKVKPLNRKSLTFHHHSVISSKYSILYVIIPFIWGPFLSLSIILDSRITLPTLYSFREVWMKESGAVSYKRHHLILSFLGHSWVILTSFHKQY